MESNKIILNLANLKRGVLALRSLNHNLRQNVIELIDSEKATTLEEFEAELGQDKSIVSQHLAILRREKFVGVSMKNGKGHYHLNEERFEMASKLVDSIADDDNDSKSSTPTRLKIVGVK